MPNKEGTSGTICKLDVVSNYIYNQPLVIYKLIYNYILIENWFNVQFGSREKKEFLEHLTSDPLP